MLKDTRYIWLKNPWNLTPKQRERLGYLEKVEPAHESGLFAQRNVPAILELNHSRLGRKIPQKVVLVGDSFEAEANARLCRDHEENILTYFDIKIDNAATKGMNRKAKVVSQRAYGYRTFETFKLALYHALGKLPMPEFTHKFL